MAVDLHVHSIFSTGAHDWADDIFRTARQRGLKAVCLTEHDTLDGLPLALEAARKHKVETMPGIEFFTDISAMGGRSIHVLGYLFDPESEPLLTLMRRLAERDERDAKRILAELRRMGVPVARKDLLQTQRDLFPEAVGRGVQGTHDPMGLVRTTARRMCRQYGWDGESVRELMRRTIPSTPLAEVLRVIHAAGGIALWAHPVSFEAAQDGRILQYGLDGFRHGPRYPTLQALMAAFREQAGTFFDLGLDGFEAITRKHPTPVIRALRAFGAKSGRPYSGGGDCHAAVAVGRTRVPNTVFTGLRRYRDRMFG
ncbi:MAG: PHP domain-containing protein [Kiritimatiellae bacterium]|nr:PHP domain-containing protein [Kiritimatiellia bacterium]